MKIRCIYIGVFSLCILCTGCSNKHMEYNAVKITNTHNQKGDTGMETNIIMTEEKKELLKKMSVNEERIEEGELFEWQEEVLRQYDYVMEYLEKKYPSYKFNIVNCEQKNAVNAYSTFNFIEESNSEENYTLHLEVADSGYSAKDNFYGYIIGPKYETKLMELIEKENIPCNRIVASLTTVQGEEFNESMDINGVINGNIRMPQSVDFYIDSNSIQNELYEDVFNRIRQLIEKKNIYGSYFVTISKNLDSDQVVFEGQFNTFN